jgi:hypothetical protein
LFLATRKLFIAPPAAARGVLQKICGKFLPNRPISGPGETFF